tara:strand:- start:1740 stop:2465 length:726 start_codon:yes stop_codon:yes gene_type:complete
MNFYPAIDLKKGKCIRLEKGLLDKITFYNKDPIDQAKKFSAMGAKWVHMVDIDGAFRGKSLNHNIILKVKRSTNCKIQVGGGIRTVKSAAFFLENKIDRIVLGTISLKNPSLVKEICRLYPGKIAVGIDTKNGFVSIEGWAKTSKVSINDLVKIYEDAGVSVVIFTDIEKDGLMEGVSFDQLSSLLDSTSLNVIASGGVSSLEDLKILKKIGAKNLVGVIAGRAIYEKKFSVNQAVEILEK